MKCKNCRGKAVVELRQHHAAFCPEHFLAYFREQVRRNIRRGSMFTRDDKLLVAVSGGKDSLALWDVLLDFGYRATGLHVHLGIGAYSARSRDVSTAWAKSRGALLLEADLSREYGLGVTGLSQALGRAPCSGCGQSKRYVFNKTALEGGFTVVATGHNLDDETATLFGNVLHWQMDYLARQSPVLEATHPRFVKKVKPFWSLTERETALYCVLRGIEYVEEECPNAAGAKSLLYKEVLNRLEDEMPGTKLMMLRRFLEDVRPGLVAAAPPDHRECARCGQPTPGDLCAFCRMWETAERRISAQRART
jgi:uncharacterized protein (TIGR00269 family)